MIDGLPIYQPGDTLQCIYCEHPFNPLERGPDHLAPQALVGHAKVRVHREFVSIHPASVIVYSPDNLQCLCPPRHQREDSVKIDKLFGVKRPGPGRVYSPDLSNPFRGDPMGFMDYMIFDFRFTDRPAYFEEQRRKVRDTMIRLGIIGERTRPEHLMRLLRFYPGGYTQASRERHFKGAQALSRRYNDAAGLALDYVRYLDSLSPPGTQFAVSASFPA